MGIQNGGPIPFASLAQQASHASCEVVWGFSFPSESCSGIVCDPQTHSPESCLGERLRDDWVLHCHDDAICDPYHLA